MNLTRRQLLGAAGALGAPLLLGGCGGLCTGGAEKDSGEGTAS